MSSCSSNQFYQRTEQTEWVLVDDNDDDDDNNYNSEMQTTFFSIWTRIHVLYGAIEWLQLIVIYSQMLFFLSSSPLFQSYVTLAIRLAFALTSTRLDWNIFVELKRIFCCYAKNAFISNVYGGCECGFCLNSLWTTITDCITVSTYECEIYWSTNTHLTGAGVTKTANIQL